MLSVLLSSHRPLLEEIKRRPKDPTWPSVVALDCEMVGGGLGGSRNLLARWVYINYTVVVLWMSTHEVNMKQVMTVDRLESCTWLSNYMLSCCRVAIVDESGKALMNDFVRPEERVTDFRKRITGINWSDLKTGECQTKRVVQFSWVFDVIFLSFFWYASAKPFKDIRSLVRLVVLMRYSLLFLYYNCTICPINAHLFGTLYSWSL